MTCVSSHKARKETALVTKGTRRYTEMGLDILQLTLEWALDDPLVATAIDLEHNHAHNHPRSRLCSAKIKTSQRA